MNNKPTRPTAGRYMVQLRAGTEGATIKALAADLTVKTTFTDGFTADLSSDQLRQLQRSPAVEFIEPDQIATALKVKQPPTQVQQLNTHGEPWGLDRIDQESDQLTGTYRYQRTGKDVRVFVLDTGVDLSHPEFQGRALAGLNVTSSPPGDRYGHGTHCAGTIGGKTYGVAKECTIVDVKVLGDDGSGSYSGIVQALDWCALQAKHLTERLVISMSLGGGRSEILNAAVERCIAAGIPVIAAAGNEAEDACLSSPASAPLAITVASSTRRDFRSSFSNFGACVDIYAPGDRVLSALPGDTSDSWSGTSMACPHVAGVVALLLEEKPKYTPEQVTDFILGAARKDRIRENAVATPNLLLAKPATL